MAISKPVFWRNQILSILVRGYRKIIVHVRVLVSNWQIFKVISRHILVSTSSLTSTSWWLSWLSSLLKVLLCLIQTWDELMLGVRSIWISLWLFKVTMWLEVSVGVWCVSSTTTPSSWRSVAFWFFFVKFFTPCKIVWLTKVPEAFLSLLFLISPVSSKVLLHLLTWEVCWLRSLTTSLWPWRRILLLWLKIILI